MTSSARRAYIDWARGLAVLLMIEAHTIDAWTRPADRKTLAYGYATVLGGFAAPLFLWLAGLGVVLSATRTAERTGSRAAAVEAVCRRGMEIFLLAFLFRLQAFIVSPGGHPVTLFRVDVLNIMGPSMVVAGLAWAWSARTMGLLIIYAALAVLLTMITPIVRASTLVDSFPLWLQWYVRPAGDFTTFTVFPWAGFVFAGAAVGALVAASRDTAGESRLHVRLAIAGVALIAAGYYAASRPSIYSVPSFFWTSSPTWFAIRVGIMMVALSLLFLCRLFAFSWQGPLAAVGRASLFTYWIHVELVYGYASWLWRHRLPLWGTAIAYALFAVLMYRAIGWRDSFVEAWRQRPRAPVSPTAQAG